MGASSPPLTDIKASAALAAAAWKDLNAKTLAYQAALLRGDESGAEAIRREAHDMLDNHMDLTASVTRATLDIIGR